MKSDRNDTAGKTKAPEASAVGTKPRLAVRRRTSTLVEPLKYTIESEEEVDFTQKEAYKFLELEVFQGERPVRESHVQFLYDEEMAGRFIWHLVTIAEAILGKERFRINGQHTAWMRVHVDDAKKRLVRRMAYRVTTGEQLRALYSAFDRNAPRTAQHVSKVQLIGTDAGEGITPGYLGRLVSGYRLWAEPNYRQTRPMNSELVAKIKNDDQLFNLVGRFFMMHYADAVFVKRAAVVGAMFATFSQSVKASDDFWSAVCSGLGMDSRGDHRWLLRRYIEGHSHTITAGKDTVSQEEMFRACIGVWNNWRAGTPITKVGIPRGEDRPKVKA